MIPIKNTKAEEFKGLVNVNPINNYLTDFPDSFNKVVYATAYIGKDDDDFENAILYQLAEIEVDNCFTTNSLSHRKECIKKLEYLGENLEKYLGI
jgi:hypothetical protein